MLRTLLLATTVLLLPAAANAALVTSSGALGASTTTTFTGTGNVFPGPGPVTLDGVTITGNPYLSYGDAGYGLAGNGGWSGFTWVATNNGIGSVRFDLGLLTSGVGGFLNYATGNGAATIVALDASLNVLESYDLTALAPISTPSMTNAGAFRGISRGTADIRYFEIQNAYILIHDLTVADEVPEPAMLGLFGLAALGLGLSRRRKVA